MELSGEKPNRFIESPDKSASDDVFALAVWQEPLQKFAKGLGLTISLYDHNLRRRSFVTSGPVGESLARSAFWADKGLGSSIDSAAAQLCIKEERYVRSVQVEMFSHLALPLTICDSVMGAFVIGWIAERFADPVRCDAVAKRIGANSMEIWQVMRMQQPISTEKLESHGRMLETFAVPLLKQLMLQIEDRARERRARIAAHTSLAFAAATTESELCAAMFRALHDLTSASSISIAVTHIKSESEVPVVYRDESLQQVSSRMNQTARSSQLRIQIPSARGGSLGKLDMLVDENDVSQEVLSEIQALAGQLGTSLQKVHLVHALESERVALRAANLQLQHMHKMKDEFLATVSHELRTPLNAILGWATLLNDFGPSEVDWKTAVNTIERNAKNQSRLIEDLLDVSRIISGKMVLHRADIEATSLVRQSLETIKPMIEARRQKLHIQVSEVPIRFKGDETRVTQIFWNLLSNASKFTPEGGDISVVLENAGHYFRFEVSDTGKGISGEFLPHLFDRFSQADQSYSRSYGGLGLGLAIVRHLVELHGGTVMAKSDGEGRGSKFTVFLPQNTTDLELDSAQRLARSAHALPESQNLWLQGMKILLVDDEPDALRLTKFVLEKRGAVIQMADTVEQGFQILREWRPDVVVSDISMPGESGYEFIRRVRLLSERDGGQTPAIALTAMAGAHPRDLALAAGFQAHISKPFEPVALYNCLVDLHSR